MYRNDWWLRCWNQNYDPPLRFQTPTWRMKIVKLRANRGKNCAFSQRKLRDCWTEVHQIWRDVDWLLPLNQMKADLRSANPLSNTEAKNKGHSLRRRLYNFLCLKLRGHWTKSRQIARGCTEMTADCSKLRLLLLLLRTFIKRKIAEGH